MDFKAAIVVMNDGYRLTEKAEDILFKKYQAISFYKLKNNINIKQQKFLAEELNKEGYDIVFVKILPVTMK